MKKKFLVLCMAALMLFSMCLNVCASSMRIPLEYKTVEVKAISATNDLSGLEDKIAGNFTVAVNPNDGELELETPTINNVTFKNSLISPNSIYFTSYSVTGCGLTSTGVLTVYVKLVYSLHHNISGQITSGLTSTAIFEIT